MLRRTVAGRIDCMGRVANPKTLERAPRYKYNSGTIPHATQLWLGVIPISNCSHCLVLKSLLRGGSRETPIIPRNFTLSPRQTHTCCSVVLENLLTINYSKTLKPNLVGAPYKRKECNSFYYVLILIGCNYSKGNDHATNGVMMQQEVKCTPNN